MPAGRSRETALVLVLLAYALFAAFWGLGSYHLIDPDEPRYSESSREMIERRDYLVPYMNGEPRLNKPPLFYWLQVASYKASGGYSELAARAPSAGAGLVMAAFVCLLARRMYGKAAAAVALPVVFSMPLFAAMTHLTTTDATMSAFLTGAFYFWWRFRESPSRMSWIAASWAMLGLAVLTKGPVALALYVLIVLAFTAWTRQWSLLRRSFHPGALAVFFCITLPWPLAVISACGDVAALWYRETLVRFISGVDHPWSPLMPVGVVLVGTLPWIALLSFPAGNGWKERVKAISARPEALFLFVWATAVTVFFTVCKMQLPSYLLPAVPPVAIAAAGVLAGVFENRPSSRAALTRLSIAAALALVAAAGFGLYRGLFAVWQAEAAALLLLLGGAVSYVLLARMRLAAAAAFLTVVVGVGAVLPTTSILQAFSTHKSLEPLGSAWNSQIVAADEVYFMGHIDSNMSLVFYAGRQVTAVKASPEYAAALARPVKIAFIQPDYGFRKLYATGYFGPHHFLAGARFAAGRTYILVTNFPAKGAVPILALPPEEIGRLVSP